MTSTALNKIADVRGLIELLGDTDGPDSEDAVFQGLEFTIERFTDGTGQLLVGPGVLTYGKSLESRIEVIHNLSYIAFAYLGGTACGPVRG